MKNRRTLKLFFLLFLFIFNSGQFLLADCQTKLSEEEKIEALIKSVEKMDGTFIRNGEEHNSKEAADHLRLKLKNAKNSFFASREDWTAKLFIEKIGTKSSISGVAYQIKLAGKTVTSEEWLTLELARIIKRCVP